MTARSAVARSSHGAPKRSGAYKARLYAPGPVEVPPQVLAAMSRPQLHHRSAEFEEIFLTVSTRLAELAQLPGEDLLILTGSGTAGFEAALLATVPAGAQLLALHAGKFGERWARMARSFGYRVDELTAAAGREFDEDELLGALERLPQLSAVTLVHSETSTGALHDVARIAELVRQVRPDALVLVDAVTSLGVSELRPREWGLDAIVSGSQKGVMTPPGLAFVWLSERAWAQSNTPPSYYLDLHRERAAQRSGQTAYTPAVNLIAGLEVSIEMLLAEGVDATWQRRRSLNEALLAAGAALGLTPLAERPSPAVAALMTPEEGSAPELVAALLRRGITIGGGQDELKPHLIRPSLLGWCDRYDLVMLAAALEDAVQEVNGALPASRGAAVAAALSSLDASLISGQAGSA